MIPWERRVILKPYLEMGVPVTALAAQCDIGRRTLHRWIRTGQLDRDLEAEQVRYKARPQDSRPVHDVHIQSVSPPGWSPSAVAGVRPLLPAHPGDGDGPAHGRPGPGHGHVEGRSPRPQH